MNEDSREEFTRFLDLFGEINQEQALVKLFVVISTMLQRTWNRKEDFVRDKIHEMGKIPVLISYARGSKGDLFVEIAWNCLWNFGDNKKNRERVSLLSLFTFFS